MSFRSETTISGGGIQTTIGTTKGDIIGFSGASTPVRQGIGSDGSILVSDSTKTDGLGWKAADTPGGGLPWYDVTAPKYAAVATTSGVATDVSAAFTSAFTDAAANGGAATVLVPPTGDDTKWYYVQGTIDFPTGTSNSDVTFMGFGFGSRIRVLPSLSGAAAGRLFRWNFSASNLGARVRVTNLYIDMQAANQTSTAQTPPSGALVFVGVDEVVVDGVYVNDAVSSGIYASLCTDVRMLNNRVVSCTGTGNPISVLGSNNTPSTQQQGRLVLMGNQITGHFNVGLDCATAGFGNVAISGNVVHATDLSAGQANGIWVEGGQSNAGVFSFTGNVIKSCALTGSTGGKAIALSQSSGQMTPWVSQMLAAGNYVDDARVGIEMTGSQIAAVGNVFTNVARAATIGQSGLDYEERDIKFNDNLVTLSPAPSQNVIAVAKSTGSVCFIRDLQINGNIINGDPLPPTCKPTLVADSTVSQVDAGVHYYGVSYYATRVTTTGTIAGSPTTAMTAASGTGLSAGMTIKVVGAGAAGADLYTTISAVAGTAVTLGANSGTDVTNAAVTAWQETQISMASISVTNDGTHTKNTLAGIPIGPNAAGSGGSTPIAGRKIYRTKAGAPAASTQPAAAQWFLLTDLNDNTTTTYTDISQDSTLGGQPPATGWAGNQIDAINMQGRIKDFQINDNLICQIPDNGIKLASTTIAYGTIANNVIFDCGRRKNSVNQYAINFSVAIDRVAVLNNRCYDSGPGTQLGGLNIQAAPTNVSIIGNDFRDCVNTASMLITGTPSGEIRDNFFVRDVYEGTATANGVTAVTVTTTAVDTNASRRQRIELFIVTPGGTPGAPFVSAVTNATSFQFKSTNAADTSTVGWRIR